jgi:hypothetical protein
MEEDILNLKNKFFFTSDSPHPNRRYISFCVTFFLDNILQKNLVIQFLKFFLGLDHKILIHIHVF